METSYLYVEMRAVLAIGTRSEMPLPNGETLQSLFQQWPLVCVQGKSPLISRLIDKVGLRALIDISCATRLDRLHIRETRRGGSLAVVLDVISVGPYDSGAAPNPQRCIQTLGDRLIIMNEKLCIDPSYERNGVAKTAIARQIRAAITDFGAIWVLAAGSGYAQRAGVVGRNLTGYDYWPKLGFDGDLTTQFWDQLEQNAPVEYCQISAAKPTKIQALRSLPDGKRIWKEYGTETFMKIELSSSNPAIGWVNSYLMGLGI